jgi:hypothetical membrane protein
MTQDVATRISGALGAPAQVTTKVTRAMLACGTIAGPLFIVVSLIQVLTRPGFDLRRHAISLLTLGDLGWIQRSNFVISGLLAVACAVGMRRMLRSGRAGTWGPLLFGGYGAGLFAAGLFTPDPALGFPPGAPAGMAATMSWHAVLHTIAFFVAFVSLVASTFVFTRRFSALGRRGWAVYCAATGVVPFPLIALSLAANGSGVVLFVMGVITSAWVAALPARLASELTNPTA